MFFTTVILAIREISRHKLRSFLTVLGIVIGVAAVVTMVTLGMGATAAVAEQISSLGANILQIRPGQGFGRGGGGQQAPDFEMADVEAIQEQIPGVRAVAPQAQASVLAVHNAANWQTTVNGTTAQFFIAQQWQLSDGRIWNDAEEQSGKAVCIIGSTVQRNLFPNEAPVGQQLRVRDLSCEVIGTLAGRGQGGFQDQDDVVLMPIKAVQRRFTGNRDIRFIMVAVDDAYDTESVQSSITNLLRERRRIRRGADDNFNIFDTRQISETLQGTTRILTAVMGAVAAVSLIVGGIGIMNIMLVSVTERTREIGIRLAIGALAREVRMQFLTEAVVLCCFGGLVGILLAFGLSIMISNAAELPFVFDPFINILSFVISALIGIIFGYFPARRASNLDPIEALRHE